MRQNSVSSLTNTAVATYNNPIFIAEADGQVQSADYAAQGASAGGPATVQLICTDAVGTFNITNPLTITGIAALTRTPFVMASTNRPFKKGAVIYAAEVISTGVLTTVPGETAIDMVLQEAVGQHFGPAWSG